MNTAQVDTVRSKLNEVSRILRKIHSHLDIKEEPNVDALSAPTQIERLFNMSIVMNNMQLQSMMRY